MKHEAVVAGSAVPDLKNNERALQLAIVNGALLVSWYAVWLGGEGEEIPNWKQEKQQ